MAREPSRCSASSEEKVRLASPTTSASATESMSSKRLNLRRVSLGRIGLEALKYMPQMDEHL